MIMKTGIGGYTAWVENGLAVKKSQAQDEL